MIEEIVNEINKLLLDGYPYSALGMALTLPDICGNIAYPNTGNGFRYKKWFDEYALPKSGISVDEGFMSVDGEVCYKLRCAYLHSGNFDLGNSGAVKDIRKFTLHYNRDPLLRFNRIAQMTDGTYQMDIDLGVLCWQLCEAAKDFYKSHQSDFAGVTVEIQDETPSEEEQETRRKLIEEKSGYTIEQIKEMKRKDRTFEGSFPN